MVNNMAKVKLFVKIIHLKSEFGKMEEESNGTINNNILLFNYFLAKS